VKKFNVLMLGVMGLLSLSLNPSYSSAFEISTLDILQSYRAQNVIDWKVGDKMVYSVKAGPFGNVGNMEKEVKSDDGKILVIRQFMGLPGNDQEIEIWLDKTNGEVVKVIRNGKEEQIPDDNLEVIDQNYETITVAAGTFDCIHIVAKTDQIPKIEVWANPQAIVMDGVAKQFMQTNLVPLTMELTSFENGTNN